jgi:hypothetical protein
LAELTPVAKALAVLTGKVGDKPVSANPATGTRKPMIEEGRENICVNVDNRSTPPLHQHRLQGSQQLPHADPISDHLAPRTAHLPYLLSSNLVEAAALPLAEADFEKAVVTTRSGGCGLFGL